MHEKSAYFSHQLICSRLPFALLALHYASPIADNSRFLHSWRVVGHHDMSLAPTGFDSERYSLESTILRPAIRFSMKLKTGSHLGVVAA